MKEDRVAHATRDHAEFSPSGISPIAKCAGYIGKRGTNAAADRGTRIHEAVEHRDPSALHDEIEVIHYNMCVEADEMLIGRHFSVGVMKTFREVRLHIPLDGGLFTFGTLDLAVANKDETMAMAIDYKTGEWPVDEPENNWQARAYTLGLFEKFPRLQKVYFYFVCPARDEILSGEFDRSQADVLRRMISKVIARAMEVRPKWLDGDPPIEDLNPNNHCQFCANQLMCPAIGGIAIEIAKRYDPEIEIPEGTVHSSQITDPDALAKLYGVSRLLEKWCGSVKAHAIQFVVEEGHELPGWSKKFMGSTKSVTDHEALANLARLHNVNDEDLKAASKYDLTKLRKAVREHAERGEKQTAEEEFLKEGLEAGVIKDSAPRYTLVQTQQ